MKTSYRVIIRDNRTDKNGLAMIYFIVQETWISTGIKIEPKYFDNGNIKKNAPKYYMYSSQLQSLKARAEQFIANLNINRQNFDKQVFEQFVFNEITGENQTIKNLSREYVNKNNISWGRSKHYSVLVNQLEAYKPNIKILNITYDFTLGFQMYLRKLGNTQNTINGKLKKMKALIHFAEKKGILNKNPLVDIKIKQVKPLRIFLDTTELVLLENYYSSTTISIALKNVLQYFLFSCYTGLRYSDIKALSRKDISETAVHVTQEKTSKPVLIPLIPKAKALLNFESNGLMFDVLSNAKTNVHLKDIAKNVGLEKNITYHCSRHTFATLSIYFGIPMEVVSELLGVDSTTVKIYAKIMEQVKFKEMAKWG